MAKMKSVAERKAEYEKKYPILQKKAINLINKMMNEGLKYNEACRVLKMAEKELEYRRSEEIMERADDDSAPNPY